MLWNIAKETYAFYFIPCSSKLTSEFLTYRMSLGYKYFASVTLGIVTVS